MGTKITNTCKYLRKMSSHLNTIPLGVRVLMYEFHGDTNTQSITYPFNLKKSELPCCLMIDMRLSCPHHPT